MAMLLARERSARRWLPLAGVFGLAAIWFAVEGFELFHPLPYVSLSMSVSFLVAAWAFFQRGIEGRPFLVAFGLFAGLAGSRAAFSGNLGEAYGGPAHLASSLTWVVFLCVLLAPFLTGNGAATPIARIAFALAILVAVAPYVRDGVAALRAPANTAVPTRRGTVFLDTASAQFFGALFAQLRPGERVLVVPEVSAVDVLFDLRQASAFVNHLPGWLDADGERREIERLEASPPDAVVILSRSTAHYGVRSFGIGFCRDLAAWIERRYRPVVAMPAGTLLRRSEIGATAKEESATR